MTVGELIEKLKECDQEKEIEIFSYFAKGRELREVFELYETVGLYAKPIYYTEITIK